MENGPDVVPSAGGEIAPSSNTNTGAVQPATASSSGLGRYVRMRALNVNEIPPHPDLAQLQTTRSSPALDVFINELLVEANGFMTNYYPEKFNVKSKGKPSPPSTGPVDLFTKVINSNELPKESRSAPGGGSAETWFARTSIHENAAKNGTASWDEFDAGLRANHSQNEKDYTPNVYDAHKVLEWTISGQESTIAGGWTNINLGIVEMAHQIPAPLDNRVFPVLILTARKEAPSELIVVQVPVDTSRLPGTKYCGGKGGKTTTGMYCSIERCDVIDDSTKVRWQMGTASDAKGVLPMWAQKMGVPGAVVKDVGLFIGWCAQQRK